MSSSNINSAKGPDGQITQGITWSPSVNNTSNAKLNESTNYGADTSNVLRGSSAASSDTIKTASNAPTSISENKQDVTNSQKLIGRQLWDFKVVFYNHQQRIELPSHTISRLYIEDDLLSWPLHGYIIVDNYFESLEKGTNSNDFYFVRSDARDEIYIQVKPVDTNNSFPDKLWKLELDAVIYDVEDLPHEDVTFKSKKFYFWDKKYQGMIEKNIQWCTSTGKRYTKYTNNPSCPKPIAHASDLERSMYTGEAIASILNALGYEEYVNLTDWDWGKSRINITMSPQQTAWDCIQYILNQHVSSDGKSDICVLNWDRGIQKWSLSPINKFFEKAGRKTPGKLQLEHMYIAEPISNETATMSPVKAPTSNIQSSEVDIKTNEYGKIVNYRFSQTSGLDNAMAFVTRPVVSHGSGHKQFNIDVAGNEIEDVRENYVKKNYVNNVLSVQNYPVMALNKTKKEQKSVQYKYSPVATMDDVNDRISRGAKGRGKILYASLFLNQSLNITVPGLTLRKAGSFIGVDRLMAGSDTVYDYQLCGQYFVVNVKHIFGKISYQNDITMTKIHAYSKLPVNEEVE